MRRAPIDRGLRGRSIGVRDIRRTAKRSNDVGRRKGVRNQGDTKWGLLDVGP